MIDIVTSLPLPFEIVKIDEGADYYTNPESSSLFRMLPANARDYVKRAPHLLEYLHILPVNTVGIPLFLPELKKDVGKMENPNIIYPVSEDTFIHIFPDHNDVRNFYIPIEPSFLYNVDDLLPPIERRIIDLIDKLEVEPLTEEDRGNLLRNFVKEVVYVKKSGEVVEGGTFGTEKSFKDKIMDTLNKDIGGTGSHPDESDIQTTPDNKVIVTPQEYRAIEYLFIRDKVDIGILRPFLDDDYIEDISCNGVGPIFIEHKIFKGLKSVIGFTDSKILDEYVIKLGEKVKKPLTYRSPVVDATLPDGSRINIVFGTEISRHGSNFTIRRVSDEPLSILQIIEGNGMNYMMAAYLWICLEFGMSMFVSGETASGKTTSLNSLTTFLPPENKIVTIEDTPELTLPHKNWTREVSKGSGAGEGEGGDVTMFDLLKSALRQRPNQILVGEIRGVEGAVAFGAMQTGHPVLSTFHAASVEKLIQRLTGNPINIPKTYVDNLNLVFIQSAVRRPGGGVVRRCLSINELVGYDPETGGFSFMASFVWDPVTDTFEFTGKGSSFLLENKVCEMLGIPENKRAMIYDEVTRRAEILERLHKSGYVRFWDLFNMISKIKKQGLLDIEID